MLFDTTLQIFWLMPPTKENYELYEEWSLAGSKDIFFADEVKSCQRIVLVPGHFLLIPAGFCCTHAFFSSLHAGLLVYVSSLELCITELLQVAR